MSDPKEAFRKQLQIIRKKFISEAEKKLQDLRDAWQAFEPNSTEARDALDSLFRHSHNFTGSGGSFELEEFGIRAAMLENYVRALTDADIAPNENHLDRINHHLDQILSALLDEQGLVLKDRDDVDPALPPKALEDVNRHVFLVEDDTGQAAELSTQLNYLGYKVTRFETPAEANEALDHEKPAAILMDVVFPQGPLAGPLSLKDLSFEKAQIPTVFISVRRDFEARLAALRAGGTHYIPKPVDIRKLAEVLEDVTQGSPGGPYRILLVDDEPQQSELHALMLEQAGMETMCVNNPQETLNALEHFKPDLVLMDLYMPQCDGAELAGLLRQHHVWSSTPIIFLSSEERFEKKVDALREGGEDFLTKPVRRHELVAMVDLRANRARQLNSLNTQVNSLLKDFDRLKAAYDNHAAVMYSDPQGHVTFANTRFLQLRGVSLVEFLGTNLRDTYHKKVFPAGLWTSIDKKSVWHGTVRDFHRDGEPFWLDLTVIPSYDQDGQLSQVIWLANDITQHYKNKDKLRSSLEKSEAELKAKRDMLACTSHEMRGSLNGLSGMAQLLEQTRLTREQREFVAAINTASNHLNGIINQTLDFSKIEAGRLELENIAFDLRRCMEDVGELLAPRAHEKHLDLVVEMHPDVPEIIYGDSLRLRQVLLNLLGNAIKFTEVGAIRLKLYCKKKNDETCCLCFQVIDTGIGIPKEQMGRLFKFFSQAHVSTSRKFGGTGLGLAISARLVEAMGGKLSVESEAGKGSTFHFNASFKYEAPTQNEGRELAGTSVLLVCNRPHLSNAIAQHLEHFGTRYRMVQNASEALNTIESHSVSKAFQHVIILHQNIQRSQELADQIHRHYEGTNLILLVRYTQIEEGRSLLKNGYASYIPHPIRKSAIYEELLRPRRANEVTTGSISSEHDALRALRQNFKVLVVDDNPVNRRITSNVLRNGGYQCLIACDGREAVDKLRSQPIDLILMDLHMPNIDGFEAAQAIRQLPGDKAKTLLVAMTGNTLQEQPRIVEHFENHITKPVDPGRLFSLLDGFLIESLKPTVNPLSLPALNTPVDMGRFNKLTQGDVALGRSLIEMFLINMRRELAALERGLRINDHNTCFQLCHGIKGACLEMGARDLARIIGRLEDASALSELSTAKALYSSIRAEFERVQQFLNQSINLDKEHP